MTQDEIFEMRKQADLLLGWPSDEKNLIAFAKLVAAKEREACANLIEAETGMNPTWQKYLAQKIRARGEA